MSFKKPIQEIEKIYWVSRWLYHATHQKQIMDSPPYEVAIETTNRCNLRCTHCGRSSHLRPPADMRFDDFRKIIDQVEYFKPFISLHAHGEPLLNRELPKMIAYTKEKGLRHELITNTTLLTEKKSRELLDSGLEYIMFSFSGGTKKTYESIHVNAKCERTLQNIVSFLKVKKELGAWDCRTRTVFVFEEKTKGEVERYEKMFELLPIDRVSISPLFNFYNFNEEAFTDNKGKNVGACKSPWRCLTVNVEGYIRGCLFDYRNTFNFGHINDVSIEETWNCERMQLFRAAHLKGDGNFDLFPECEQICRYCNEFTNDQFGCTSTWPKDFSQEVESIYQNGTVLGFTTSKDSIIDRYEIVERRAQEWIDAFVSDDPAPWKRFDK